ncbi:uncharacterized protein BCR38DRAFT_491315 [Pseudomassariella vexata]|uniref:TOM core complex subunit Tom6 n=1 Tax=Pseudomassariella vexata TaxID=1141098 RepID=A0A1Y2D8L6_9PEZI|nr:uncharacterized protein BCR38DRAFT_491315 [Pseudomassariella vexata]ORY54965.1 hypothetical protein BCR38DRAFT_491315 [Pseudomassariella vexata]
MPTKRIQSDSRRASQSRGYIGLTYDTITSPDNATMVRSIAIFGAAVAFIASPWAEFLLPP